MPPTANLSHTASIEHVDRLLDLKQRFLAQEEFLGTDKPVNQSSPLASITVITYQHGPYIRQCLESLLAQRTTFPYEIIIGEDGSTDGTRAICVEFAKRHQDRIRLFLRDRAVSTIREKGVVRRFNGRLTEMSVRGRYRAICEGDDYWIDPDKLQRQVMFLEDNPAYGLVHTNFATYVQAEERLHPGKRYYHNITDGDAYDQLLYSDFIKTLTVCFRHDLVKDRPLLDWSVFQGDKYLWLTIARQAKIQYFPEVTAVYRVLDNSASHPRSVTEAHRFFVRLRNLDEYFQELDPIGPDLARKLRRKWNLKEVYFSLLLGHFETLRTIPARDCLHVRSMRDALLVSLCAACKNRRVFDLIHRILKRRLG